MLLIAGFTIYISMRSGSISSVIDFVVLIIIWTVLFGGGLTWWNARRQFLRQPGAHGPRTVSLDHAGAHWRWNGGSSDVEWKNYIRMVEGRNQFLTLYVASVFQHHSETRVGIKPD
jgi:hypothetical protein